jgi:hypothetical protein
VYKYDENWNLMEKVEYTISEDRRDTVAHNMILYRYNENGNIEQTSEYDYVVSSSSWEIQADKILQYAYNKKGLEVLRTTKHSKDNAYQIKNYTKSTYNRKGNKIKERYYSDLPGDQGIKKISTTRFKYDPESNHLIRKITKNKYIEWREEYYYQEDKLIRTIKYEKETIEDEKEKTEYFDYIYKNDLLIKLKHYRIEEEESDFSFSIYKYIKR